MSAATVLACSPAAGVFRVPPLCARAGGVVEDQRALAARTATQSVGLHASKLLGEPAGQTDDNGGVVPHQALMNRAVVDRQLDMRGAGLDEGVERPAVDWPAGEKILGHLDSDLLDMAEGRQVVPGDRSGDERVQLSGGGVGIG